MSSNCTPDEHAVTAVYFECCPDCGAVLRPDDDPPAQAHIKPFCVICLEPYEWEMPLDNGIETLPDGCTCHEKCWATATFEQIAGHQNEREGGANAPA